MLVETFVFAINDPSALGARAALEKVLGKKLELAADAAWEPIAARWPNARLFLVGEIIHNPHVNSRLQQMGVRFLEHGADGEFDFSGLSKDDVVIMPAFGVPIRDFERLKAVGCVLVDTTCGSVLNVWKNVEKYARDGFTLFSSSQVARLQFVGVLLHKGKGILSKAARRGATRGAFPARHAPAHRLGQRLRARGRHRAQGRFARRHG